MSPYGTLLDPGEGESSGIASNPGSITRGIDCRRARIAWVMQ